MGKTIFWRLIWGRSTLDVTREITTLGLQANSDYDSYSVSIVTDLSKNIKLSERVTMVPSIGVGYSRIERESFTESGSIGLAALDVEKQGLDSVTSKLGLRFDVDLTDKIVWCVGGSWEHEYADLNKDQEASFVGDVDSEIFEIEGVNIDENTYTISTGFNYNVNESMTYRVIYS
ncbi:autotransporter outer membrane beta-barrel domain-containing protein [uncultured Ilyobacter sp.]|uniref:autotransporter outer membrane beta-barrel domain-containing protein n=1 Tax=uncultured Ilyobacter sp. TaxID=544433 RepID=UPI0029F47894|nr:autotransporter outer membrane beta-barrel domain-containing protein [uncultured Ilyobacter sp.]